MGVIYRLTGTDEARGWLALARTAETIEDAEAFLSLHASLMKKVQIARTPARKSRASAQLVRTREAV